MVDEREVLVAVIEALGEVAELRALCARVAVGEPGDVFAAGGSQLVVGVCISVGVDERVFGKTWQVDKGWLSFPLVGTGKYRATENLLFAGGNVNAEVDCLEGERERQEE